VNEQEITEQIRALLAQHDNASPLDRAHHLLTAWMWECKIQGWMFDNRAIEELLQVTEREIGYH